MNSNRLYGPIPPELGNLTELYELTLNSNTLSGPIPPELGRMTSLTYAYLYDNTLTGSVPAELGLLPSLSTLDVKDNSLSGEIPAEIGDLTNLYGLYLDGNSLSGPVPATLGGLTRLNSLRLSGNSLTGCIPANLSTATIDDGTPSLPFCDAGLQSLAIAGATLDPTFSADHLAYTAATPADAPDGAPRVTVSASLVEWASTLEFLDTDDVPIADADPRARRPPDRHRRIRDRRAHQSDSQRFDLTNLHRHNHSNEL